MYIIIGEMYYYYIVDEQIWLFEKALRWPLWDYQSLLDSGHVADFNKSYPPVYIFSRNITGLASLIDRLWEVLVTVSWWCYNVGKLTAAAYIA